jgi:hypothetical protein
MCEFKIGVQGNVLSIVERAKEMIERDGGSLSYSDSRALFSVRTPVGNVDGTCVWADSSTISVTITKKPPFVPCSAVEEKMVAAFADAGRSSAE